MKKYLLLVCFSFPLLASPFNPKVYKYQKEVTIKESSEGNNSSTIGKLQLDEEIFLNSFYGDLRLIANETPVPYLRKLVKVKNRSEENVEVKQLINRRENDIRVLVLELPKLPKDHVYTSILTNQDGQDEATLQVSTGATPDSMSFIAEAFVYTYSENPQNKIVIGPTKHRFVRITMPITSNIRFETATREKIQTNAYFIKEIEKIEGEKKEDTEVYQIENLTRSPFTHLKLFFQESKFERDLKIEHLKNGKQWETVFETRVSHSENEDPDLFLALGQMISSTYRITITNGENPPLHLKGITQLQTKEELVFFLPSVEKTQLKLYYGNRYARTPDFDPNLIPNETDEAGTIVHLANGSENPEFGFSLVEPP